MFRLVFELLIGVLLFTVIRAVAGFFIRSFRAAAGSNAQPQTKQPGSLPLTGELKRDPVCGTYTVAGTSLQQTVNGETHYFCSARCRDEFLAAARR